MSRLTSPFGAAVAAAGKSLAAAAGVAVTYHRASASVTLTALPGHTDFSEAASDGLTTTFTSADFIVDAALLVLSGSRATPQRGDRITRKVGTLTHTYEVLTPPYRWSDTEQTRLRIHTKKLSVA